MSRLKALGFLLVFLVPATLPAAAWLAGNGLPPALAGWFPLFALFVLLPLLDYALGHDSANVPPALEVRLARARWFRGLPLAALPVHLGVLAWSGWWFSSTDLGVVGAAGWLLSQGVVGGVLAINTAHELIHKDSRLEQAVGGLLLASVGYHGFKVEHLRGHHVHVSTPEDASSARYGQSLWHFLPRALLRNTRNAWRLEAERLRRLGLPPLHWRNELIGWTLVWLAMAAGMAAWLGPAGLGFFLLQGLFAASSLEVINYIEHYGLERRRLPDGRYERTTHLHSWNSDYRLSNLMLFQLQRHSDHHAFPKRPYAILRHHADSPQLPGGYAAMFVLALVPPLWFRVIHPRLAAFRGG
ncbi:alkane 1-monooxygenase [Silanimonas lenta]|uniref:alkane 1-monooxygenase n=1 Tax=Silanimonas lenta TaxID=265429 RepID=UPI002FE0F566